MPTFVINYLKSQKVKPFGDLGKEYNDIEIRKMLDENHFGKSGEFR